jgi:hypothetical protein
MANCATMVADKVLLSILSANLRSSANCLVILIQVAITRYRVLWEISNNLMSHLIPKDPDYDL